jgi:trehalose 6-phosphate phosphatase
VEAAELVRNLRPHLDGALVATDFDGTLAPLVLDPQTSRPVDGAIDALKRLADRGAQVAVITGRDAATVVRLGGFADVPGIEVAGLYGLETWAGGELRTPDEPPGIAALRERLPVAIAAAGPDAWVEDKRLSLVAHFRRTPDPDAAAAAVRDSVTRLGTELGFEVHPGSQVLELRVPGYDKAGALARLAQGRPAVLYLGDDLGDLPAFEQIRHLRAAGAVAYSVAVRSSRVADLEGRADVDVDDPAAAVDLLRALAE